MNAPPFVIGIAPQNIASIKLCESAVLTAMDQSYRVLACWQFFEKLRVIPLGALQPIR